MRGAAIAALAMTVCIGGEAHAQQCERTDTAPQCIDRFVQQAQTEQEAKTAATTATAVTGLTNGASPAESSLKDFLALLDASMESATSSQKGDAFTFDWNPPFSVAQNIGLKLQASFAEAKLNDSVTKALAANTDRLDDLSDSLEFGDDTKLGAYIGRNSFTHGRSIRSQAKWFRPMRNVQLATRQPETDAVGDLMDDFKLLDDQRLGNQRDGTPLNDDAVEKIIASFEELGASMKTSRAARQPFFEAFAKLLNNQPQYYGAIVYHARRNVIGPNEWSGKFTYEFAGNNLNTFRKANPGCAEEVMRADKAAECAQKLTSFANTVRPGIERVAVSLEYHKVNRRWIADPDAGLDLGFPRTRSFVGTVAFGTNTAAMLPLRAANSGVADARVDFTAKYELPEDDESDAKGFVGTLTFTQKISDTFSLPLSLVYSDHESDLIDVQKRFSARFGVMYKLPDFK